jgi:hypothetical protein
MSRTNNKQGPIVGVGTFGPIGDSTPITDTVGLLPFGGSGVTATAGGRNQWIGYSGTTPLIYRTAAKVFTLTVQQFNGRSGLNAAGGSAILNTRRLVKAWASAGAGTVVIAAGGSTVIGATPAAAAAASTFTIALPDSAGLCTLTFTFSAAQAGNIMVYDDGYQQFEVVGTSA